MSEKLLQVNMKFCIPRAELETVWLDAARPIADTPGLRWKVWLMNEAEREAGGVYLFASEAAVEAYLAGPIVAGLKASSAVSDITVKVSDVLERHTAITRGPAAERCMPATAPGAVSPDGTTPTRVHGIPPAGRST